MLIGIQVLMEIHILMRCVSGGQETGFCVMIALKVIQVIRKGCSEREGIPLIYQQVLNRKIGVNFFLPSGGKCIDFKGLSCNRDLSFLPEID